MASSSKRRVRYAVVGAGNIAQVAVLPAFAHARENSELVAIISGDPMKREELSKRYHLERAEGYANLEEVIAQARIDAVYIASDNAHHRELTERSARAGAHVLCEKPMATRVADGEAMLETTQACGVKLMIAYRLHFEEANLRAAQLLEEQRIGEPKIFTGVFTQQVRPRDIRTRSETGGGALLDLGIYPINAARNLFRDEPVEVTAVIPASSDERFKGVDETTCVILRFPRGQMAQLTVSLGASSHSSYSVIGSHGELRVEPAYDYATDLVHHLTVHGHVTRRAFAKRDQFAPELVYFSRCILEDQDPEPSGEEGIADLRVIEAAFESARTGQAVRLPYFDRSQRPSLRQSMQMPPVKEPKPVHAPSPSQG
jgi:predicted dehydrogenase